MRSKTVEEYMTKVPERWIGRVEELRQIFLAAKLEETIKWGAPCYTYNGKNVVGLGVFKSYFGIWFYQGVHLKDEAQVLINAQENKTKSLRQWRFQDEDDVPKELVSSYVLEAIQIQESNIQLPSEPKKSLEVPKILEDALNDDPVLKAKFDELTMYKQKEYCEHISSAKREATKLSRLEKSIPLLLQGKGLHDKYR